MKLPSHFRRRMLISVCFFVATLIYLAAAAPGGWAKDQIPFAVTKIIFEFNFTAQDLGIQVSLDGEPWKEIKIVNPDGRKMFQVKASGNLKKFGLTELFAESNEPNFAEMSKEEILALFPEGEYKFFGRTVEGDKLSGTALLTHNIPDGPVIVSPVAGAVVNPNNTVISWNAVTTPLGINIVGYQVIVERSDALRAFDVKLPGTVTQVMVPPEFLEPGTLYNFEVLAIEEGGNQTITEGGTFTTP